MTRAEMIHNIVADIRRRYTLYDFEYDMYGDDADLSDEEYDGMADAYEDELARRAEAILNRR